MYFQRIESTVKLFGTLVRCNSNFTERTQPIRTVGSRGLFEKRLAKTFTFIAFSTEMTLPIYVKSEFRVYEIF